MPAYVMPLLRSGVIRACGPSSRFDKERWLWPSIFRRLRISRAGRTSARTVPLPHSSFCNRHAHSVVIWQGKIGWGNWIILYRQIIFHSRREFTYQHIVESPSLTLHQPTADREALGQHSPSCPKSNRLPKMVMHPWSGQRVATGHVLRS
jgi:hypothetical protein